MVWLGARRRAESFGFKPGQDELVDRIPGPASILDRGESRPLRWLECPVLAPGRSLVDPFLQQLDLVGSQLLARLRRRHLLVGVVTGDAFEQLAVAGLAGHDDRVSRPECTLLEVEPQVGFSTLGVWTVAEEAVFRQDRQDVQAESDRLGFAGLGSGQDRNPDDRRQGKTRRQRSKWVSDIAPVTRRNG